MSDDVRKNYETVYKHVTQKIANLLVWLDKNKTPTHVKWVDVEEMTHLDFQLKEITDRLFREGEYKDAK